MRKFTEMLNSLTGISTPVVGVSWSPGILEVTIARKVIAFLEDRRVLYLPSEAEIPAHCIHSVLEIRKFLTEQLGGLDSSSDLAANLKAMRAACRKFLNTVGDESGDIVKHGFRQGHWANWVFLGALGEMRGVFGIHLAKIAVQHKLDIEDDLASILPFADEENMTNSLARS